METQPFAVLVKESFQLQWFGWNQIKNWKNPKSEIFFSHSLFKCISKECLKENNNHLLSILKNTLFVCFIFTLSIIFHRISIHRENHEQTSILTLFIKSMDREDDNIYICLAHNDYGYSSISSKISVLGKWI